MRKYLLLSLLTLMLVILAACGGNDDKKGGDSNANVSSDEEITLKFAGILPIDHPATIAMETLAEKVENETNGRIKMDIYPANQLGDYMLLYEEIGKGSVDMGLISVPSHLDSRTEMIILPYLFKDYDHVKEQYQIDKFIGQKFQELHNEQGIQLLGFEAQGFGGIGSVSEINEPLNFDVDKNVLVRVPEVDIFIKNTEDLGFKTVPLAYADLYSAMQSKTVEGWTGGHPQVNYLQFRDVINYYYQYNNFFEAHHLLINKDVWDSFSEEEQEIIQTASNELTNLSFENSEKIEREYLDKLAEEGIEVIEFTEEELETLAQYSRENSWGAAEDSVGKELLDELLEALEE